MPTPPFPPIEPASIEAELKDSLPSLFGAGLASTEVPKAFAHQTFLIRASDGRSYLLKIPRLAAEIARLESIAKSAALARKGGVRTPEIASVAAAVSRFGGRPYLLQDFWPGRDAADSWPELGPKARESFLREWGVETGRLHSIRAAIFTEGTVPPGKEASWGAHVANRFSRLLVSNQRAQVLAVAELKAVGARLDRLMLKSSTYVEPRLAHRDLHLRNVLLSPEGNFAALLDFEHARFSDPVMDFVKLKAALNEREPGAEGAFFSGYRQVHRESWPYEAERYETALILELLGEIPYCKRNNASQPLEAAVSRLRALLDARPV